ncbi:hypothetical protein B0T20DRAFT_481477 [Sordaria brevicollis]|uniref:Uncharacterized protein n=1 Tax=Sordaria brevicollis TaxID=83679 RepID=A0AAE0UAK2_SORBR|nr:hypothetical protein B0T20DRAFT_481477 [Sordaria brevicollis]
MPNFSRRADDNIMAIQKTPTSRSGSSSVHSSTSKPATATTTPSTTTKGSKPTKAGAGKEGKSGSKFGLGGIFHKVADWASTSEPSMAALNQYKQEAFQRAGVSTNDADPHTKLHAPIGEIPEDAIRPTTGPTPEEVLMRKKAERQRRKLEEEQRRGNIGSGGGGRGGSVRSGSVSSSTMSGGLHYGVGFHNLTGTGGSGTGTGTASSTVGSGSSRKGSVSGGSSAVPWDTSGW